MSKALRGLEQEAGRSALGQVLVPRVNWGNAAAGHITATAPGSAPAAGIAPQSVVNGSLNPAGVRINYGALPDAGPARNALGILVAPTAPRIGVAQTSGAMSSAARANGQINGSVMVRPSLRAVTIGGPAKPQPGAINGTDFRARH